jgi:tRNA-specific 2-thiouridylase
MSATSFPSKNKSKVIVGISGGVDSSVAAWQMKQQGYEVEALFMKNWEEDDDAEYCSHAQDLRDATQVCNLLDIRLHTANFSQEYWEHVFSYFLEEYQSGRTPNPDILCNKEIKFKAFLDYAKQLGADKIVTGHYVRLDYDPTGKALLKKAVDNNKDQTYFLYALNQNQLQQSLFPIGDLNKPEVREIAEKLKLVTHDKKDSTGICFIGERKFKAFLNEYLPSQPGDIQTIEGTIIGRHDGLMYHTLGQRKGLKIGGLKNAQEKPWYVVAKDLKQNRLIVGQGHAHPWLQSTQVIAQQLNWISDIPPIDNFTATAKVRYRHKDAPCQVRIENNKAIIEFENPQWAVTPGQSIVFYQDDLCLGGGIIENSNSDGGIWNT